MEDEVNESVENLEVADQEETVGSTVAEEVETAENTAEETTETAENTTEKKTEENTEEEKQTEKDNKFARMARLRAEKEAEKKIEQARKEGIEQGKKLGKIESVFGKQNPYTGEIINDEYDAQEYFDMFDLDSAGKDPVKGYRELQKEKYRTEAKMQLELDEKAKQEKWYQDDTKEFIDKYSSEKLNELMKDEDFNVFASGKIGQVPLAKIYQDYTNLISKYEKKSVDTAKKLVANNVASPGKADEGENQDINWTNMSSAKFEEYLKKAKDGELR